MGDVVTLVEQAQETFDQERAERLVRKMKRRRFTMADYLEQLVELRKMGSLTSVLEKLPGMQGAVASGAVNEKALRREEAIMLSMTPAERDNPRILGPSRRKRVARGSGTSVSEVNRLVRKFDKMSLAMKKMTRNKKLQQQMVAQLGG